MVRKVTTEDLARMVKGGFDGVDKRFDETDKRFDKVENRLDRIESYLLKKHEVEIERVKERVKNLEDLFAMPLKK